MDDFKINLGDSDSRLFDTIFPKKLSKGEKKKLDIIEKAIQLFGEKGVDAVSYDDLAKALSTSRSHISYHFKEKDQLIQGAVRVMMTEGQGYTIQKMKEALSAKERVKSYVHGYYGFFLENPVYIPLLTYFFYASSIHEDYRVLQADIRKIALNRIYELLSQLYKEEGKRPPKDLNYITVAVQNLVIGSTVVSLMTTPKNNKEEMEETQRIILEGISRLTKVKNIV